MISLARLNTAPDEDFVTALGGIYEHSDWVPQRLVQQRPFPDVGNLRLAMRQTVENATDAEKLALIRTHPDLAGKLAKAGMLTAESSREQVGLGLDRLTTRNTRGSRTGTNATGTNSDSPSSSAPG